MTKRVYWGCGKADSGGIGHKPAGVVKASVILWRTEQILAGLSPTG